MTLSRIRRVFFLAGACLGMAATVHACSLNPQPLPPGDTPDAASNTVGGGGDAGGYFGAGADSGTPLVSDGAPAGNDGADGGVAAPPEGGDAGDAGDAGDGASDAAADAPEDAPADAPTDGEEGGG